MGRPYYYFAASLPILDWNRKCPFSAEEFCLSSDRLLGDEDSVLIKKLLDGADDIQTKNPAACAWIRFEKDFRNEAAWFRAHKAHKDPVKSVRGTKENEPHLRNVVHEAARMDNFLEAETLFDQTRWQFLDDLSRGHNFDFEFIMCYGLKLKILERQQAYRSSKGKEVFDEICTMELPVNWAVSGI